MLIVGMTGSGKSELARLLTLSAARHPAGRIAIIDPAGSATTDLPGAVTIYDPHKRTTEAGTDWTKARIMRFVPTDPLDLDAYDQLYRVLWNLRDDAGDPVPILVWVDEAGIPMPAHGAPKAARRYIVQGRKRGLGQIANHTRPVDLDKYLITQAAWVIVFYTPDHDDRTTLAKNKGVPRQQLEQLHRELEAQHAALVAAGQEPPGSIPHGFIVFGPGVPPRLCAPLPL